MAYYLIRQTYKDYLERAPYIEAKKKENLKKWKITVSESRQMWVSGNYK